MLTYCVGVVVAVVSLYCGWVECDITLTGAKCGVKNCNLSEYCSNFDRTCQPCSGICDSSHHNYEPKSCEKECQDYLHDLRYVTRDGSKGDNEDLRSTVAHLSRMVTVTLTLVCLMLIVLASVLCFQLYRWKIKKNITLATLKNKFFNKQHHERNGTSKTTNAAVAEDKKADLRLEIPSNRSQSDNSPVTVTTSISRRPAEDSTLDYAYDNPAMSTPR